jgi:hypothetical protein
MKHIYTWAIFAAILLCGGCSDKTGPTKLVLKFKPGQIVTSETIRNSTIKKFINDSLVQSYPFKEIINFKEETLDTLPGGKGLLAWTSEVFIIAPDSLDPNLVDTLKWLMTIETIQHPNGYNEFYAISDSSRLSMIDYYKRYLEQMSLILPDQAVGVGYEWDHAFKVILKDGERKDATNHFRVTGFEKKMGYDCVVIDRDAVMILPLQYPAPDSVSTLIRLTQINYSSRSWLALDRSILVYEETKFRERVEGTWYKPDGIKKFRHETEGTGVTTLTDVK